jgi:hypothetical protein
MAAGRSDWSADSGRRPGYLLRTVDACRRGIPGCHITIEGYIRLTRQNRFCRFCFLLSCAGCSLVAIPTMMLVWFTARRVRFLLSLVPVRSEPGGLLRCRLVEFSVDVHFPRCAAWQGVVLRHERRERVREGEEVVGPASLLTQGSWEDVQCRSRYCAPTDIRCKSKTYTRGEPVFARTARSRFKSPGLASRS